MPRIRNVRPDTFSFRPGRKPVWLPNFTLTLIRTLRAPPTTATFIVPRKFNKLDIRDYLWHVYGVPVLRVRSWLRFRAPRFGRPGQKAPLRHELHAQKPEKRMMVEMAPGERGGAFVWPEVPEDLSPWDHETHKLMEEYQEKQQEDDGGDLPGNVNPAKKEGKEVAEQARALREAGPAVWRPSWRDFGRTDADRGGGAFDPSAYQKASQERAART